MEVLTSPPSLEELAETEAAAFQEAWPFPHAKIDGLFDDAALDAVVSEWPEEADRAGWSHFSNHLEEKWAWTPGAALWPAAAEVIDAANGPEFLRFLETLTGIPGLVADPDLVGGGPHEIRRGGKLAVHADFNRHPYTQYDRRLNALLYLNEGWRDDWGGQIELWDEARQMSVSYAPLFNRLVVFTTTATSYHGHPHPLQCPEWRARRSLAFYYYTRPDGAQEAPHSTLFVDTLGSTT